MHSAPATSRPSNRHRGRLTASAGVVGELMITVGVVLLLFVAWELWWTNIDADRTQNDLAHQTIQQFPGAGAWSAGDPKSPAATAIGDREKYGAPPAASLHGSQTFGMLYVPRFGDDYGRPISEGVGSDVLDHLGIGHYPGTQLPGEAGNFAVAAHRQTHGQVFWNIDKLTEGDRLYVQTQEGYYTYRYRDTEIVDPSETGVLLPVPHQPDQRAAESLLTLTSCDPPFTTRMRIIAYAELESWRPPEAGPPAAIADTVRRASGAG